jgi:hypothetical protein
LHCPFEEDEKEELPAVTIETESAENSIADQSSGSPDSNMASDSTNGSPDI